MAIELNVYRDNSGGFVVIDEYFNMIVIRSADGTVVPGAGVTVLVNKPDSPLVVNIDGEDKFAFCTCGRTSNGFLCDGTHTKPVEVPVACCSEGEKGCCC